MNDLVRPDERPAPATEYRSTIIQALELMDAAGSRVRQAYDVYRKAPVTGVGGN